MDFPIGRWGNCCRPNMMMKGASMFERNENAGWPRQPEQSGFTLIELLIVIAVLGILAAVTVFGLSGIGGQSLTSACHADAKSVAVAQEAYRSANGVYYPSTPAGAVSGTPIVSAAPGSASPAVGLATYLRTPPGNVTKYVIATDNTGAVFVQNITKNATAPGVNAETYGAAANDPCAGL